MACAASEAETQSLLSHFELLHQGYKDAIAELQSLKARLAVEVQRREVAESLCKDLERDVQLLKGQGDTLSSLLQQLESRSKYESLLKEFVSLKQHLADREKEYEELISSLSENNSKEISALENRIRQSQEELTLRDAAVSHLQQELLHLQCTFKEMSRQTERSLEEKSSKYQSQVRHLVDELDHMTKEKDESEERLLLENSTLQEHLNSLQKQLAGERANFENKLKESSYGRHAEVFKQKIMKLRKENERLRAQLLGVCHDLTSEDY